MLREILKSVTYPEVDLMSRGPGHVEAKLFRLFSQRPAPILTSAELLPARLWCDGGREEGLPYCRL